MVEKAPEKTVTYKGTQRISIPPHSSIEQYSIPNALLTQKGAVPASGGLLTPSQPKLVERALAGLHALWPALPGAPLIITNER